MKKKYTYIMTGDVVWLTDEEYKKLMDDTAAMVRRCKEQTPFVRAAVRDGPTS